MKNFKRMAALIMAAALLVTCLAGCGDSATTSEGSAGGEIFIGATGPLTGDASSYGISANNGAMLAVE